MWKKIFLWHIWQKKHIITHSLTLVFAICGLFLLNNTFAQDCGGDLMQQAFCTAKSYDTVLDMWETKDAVWNNILREWSSVEIEDNFWDWCFINGQFVNVLENDCLERWWDRDVWAVNISTKEPLIVRITKFLLRMTIVLSITMVIFNSVLYMIEVMNWKDRKSAEAKNNLARVAWWVIIALMSVGIINLVVSVPKSSLKTSDDLWWFEIWCQTWWTIVIWNDLKQWVCLNSLFDHIPETMEFRERDYLEPFSMSAALMDDRALWWFRCKIADWDIDAPRENFKWKKISSAEMKSKCVSDMWWNVVE